jgi:UDP:flavonoid glycosyltransferase YjiC (YdhE family)
VRVEPFVVQAELLPHCATVICHGGSGTVLAALAHAVPVVCIPQGADQFANAANVARVGAGVALDVADADGSMLGGAIGHVLGAPGPREAAAALAREIHGMPGVADVASSIEELVAGQPASWG